MNILYIFITFRRCLPLHPVARASGTDTATPANATVFVYSCVVFLVAVATTTVVCGHMSTKYSICKLSPGAKVFKFAWKIAQMFCRIV